MITKGGPGVYGLSTDKGPLAVVARESVIVDGSRRGGAVTVRWPDRSDRAGNKAFDGAVIGADDFHPRGTPLSQVRGVRPSNGRPPTHRIIYVNGINTPVLDHRRSLQAIADKAGAEVIGIYNATEGTVGDLRQAARDKRNRYNEATDTLERLLYAELKSSRPIAVVAHSQGAIDASNAVANTRRHLKAAGLSPQEAERRLGLSSVTTLGGAAWTYPDGPNYHHYVNRLDPVPNTTGVGTRAFPGGPRMASPGRGAKITEFTSVKDAPLRHSLEEVYLPNWKP